MLKVGEGASRAQGSTRPSTDSLLFKVMHLLLFIIPIQVTGTKPHVPWPTKLLFYNYTPCWKGALLKLEEDQLVKKISVGLAQFWSDNATGPD